MNFDLSPTDRATPKVRLFGDSFAQSIVRKQNLSVMRSGVKSGEPTEVSNLTGTEPPVVRIVGWWIDPDTSSTLADRLETLLNDTTVETVELQGVNESSRYDGRYVLGDESRVRQVTSDSLTYRYDIRLTESD